ncbi:MAG: acyloxyacyl hydrolase [Phycisphaeraceae bacterium]
MARFLTLTAAVLIAFGVATTARAEGPAVFSRGSWSMELFGSGSFASKGEIYSGHVGASYYFVDHVALSLQASVGRIRSGVGEDATVGALDLLIRHHLLRGDGWTLFIEGGAGIQRASERFPETHFNFRPQGGVGMTLQLREDMHLITGVRHLHISNAGRSSPNVGYEGIMPYLGVSLQF